MRGGQGTHNDYKYTLKKKFLNKITPYKKPEGYKVSTAIKVTIDCETIIRKI